MSVALAGRVVTNTQTNTFGRYTVHNLSPGSYTISVRMLGFSPKSRVVTVGRSDVTHVDFALVPAAVNLSTLNVTAKVPIALDTRTGNQVFNQNDYHGAPTSTSSQILQNAIAGAARAPTGEVHIRGQHAEYTYYIDGVPVPPGISGSLNEVFDPNIVSQITFQTGGWDAEYGNRNTAIINVTTRVPAGGFHGQVSSYGGVYDPNTTTAERDFNGQALSASTNSGPWGFFFSGQRQVSDMRQEPVMFDSTTREVVNFSNHGTDYYGFGKVQYTPSTHDVVNLDLNASRTRFQIPFDSSDGAFLNDHQTDVNSFANLGWHHEFTRADTTKPPPDLFAALSYRYGSLAYVPGNNDVAQFTFFPDTTPFNLAENRNFSVYGLKLDYAWWPRHHTQLKAGTQLALTRGQEDFTTTAQDGSPGPASNSGLNGTTVGTYAQTAFSPVEWFELRTGIRYDAQDAPFAGTQTQWSPRIRLNFFPSPSTTIFAYYGRLFMPTNVEDLRAITSVAQGGIAATATLPERDNFYELALVRRVSFGLSFKLDAYHKDASPGLDDNTVPGSAIVTSVNIATVHTTGIEGVIDVQPKGPVTGYLNVALAHAYGHGPITGGFFPVATPAGNFDLDHDQRLSMVASATYSPNRLFLSGTAIYGSGLANGVDPADCGCRYGTSLFAFNPAIKVAPSTIVNMSAGYSIIAGKVIVQPQLYAENLFDRKYLLKGAFFSGASVGRPRNIQFRVNLEY